MKQKGWLLLLAGIIGLVVWYGWNTAVSTPRPITHPPTNWDSSATETGWTPWLQDEQVVAITPLALNGFPGESKHSNWLQLNATGHILGSYPMVQVWHVSPP